MSTFSYLQPNLMTTEDLRSHLKLVSTFLRIFSFKKKKMLISLFLQRFPNQNVSTLVREELLKLFSMYAMPKSRRATSNEIDVDMKTVTQPSGKRENENKRPRHQLITAPTVETVTNECKKIRLINNERLSSNNKRKNGSTPMVRKRIFRTWKWFFCS